MRLPSDIRVRSDSEPSGVSACRWAIASRMRWSDTPASSSRLMMRSSTRSPKPYRRWLPEPSAGRTEGVTRFVRAQ